MRLPFVLARTLSAVELTGLRHGPFPTTAVRAHHSRAWAGVAHMHLDRGFIDFADKSGGFILVAISRRTRSVLVRTRRLLSLTA